MPFWLVRNSRIIQLIRKVDIDAKRRQYNKDYREINIDFYKEPKPNSDWSETWEVTEGLIKLMGDEVYKKSILYAYNSQSFFSSIVTLI